MLKEKGKGMLNQQNEFFWGDKWAVENGTGWFVAGRFHVLFSVDMVRDHYKIVAALPGSLNSYRQNSNCMKCENTIFCMPNNGDCIWCYDLLTLQFHKIEIVNPNCISIGIGDYWRTEGVLWAVSSGLKQILEIDIKKKRVIGYYNITDRQEDVFAKCAKDGNYIYITSASEARVYVFDIEKKEVKEHDFSGVKNGLRTISVDKEKVWLTGYNREIYIWNQVKNEIKSLRNFPSDFGIYNFNGKKRNLLDCRVKEYDTFTFLENIDAGGYIWYIPFQTNQILYVNKDTNEINVFEIEEEEENEETIKNRKMDCKYVLQYVYEDRYIGLYSIKNEIVFEIDTKTLEVKKRIITMDTESLEKKLDGWILNESFSAEQTLYGKLIGKSMEHVSKKEMVGEKIFNYMR